MTDGKSPPSDPRAADPRTGVTSDRPAPDLAAPDLAAPVREAPDLTGNPIDGSAPPPPPGTGAPAPADAPDPAARAMEDGAVPAGPTGTGGDGSIHDREIRETATERSGLFPPPTPVPGVYGAGAAAAIDDDLLAAIRTHRNRFTWLGISLIVVGLAAILFPLIFSIVAKVLVGWVLLVGGAAMLWHAFQARDWASALQSGAIGVLYLAMGVYLAFFPLTGLIGLTALLGVIFLLQGGVEAAMALRHRPRRGWGWLALSGAASVLLGVLLIAGLPQTALWALGLMLGINLVSSGVSFVALARGA